jgi:hypothetical protein
MLHTPNKAEVLRFGDVALAQNPLQPYNAFRLPPAPRAQETNLDKHDFKQTLRNTAGFVEDGTTSTAIDNNKPVAQTLGPGTSNNAVSQHHGLMLWIKPNSWTAGMNPIDPFVADNGNLTLLGYGTLLHEIIHKYTAAPHSQIRVAPGLPEGPTTDFTDINLELSKCLDVSDPWRHL